MPAPDNKGIIRNSKGNRHHKNLIVNKRDLLWNRKEKWKEESFEIINTKRNSKREITRNKNLYLNVKRSLMISDYRMLVHC